MPVSDLVGLGASLSLLIPVLKDQYLRFETARHEERQAQARWRAIADTVASAWRAKRDGYSGWDSFFTFLGILGLVVSFFMKVVES